MTTPAVDSLAHPENVGAVAGDCAAHISRQTIDDMKAQHCATKRCGAPSNDASAQATLDGAHNTNIYKATDGVGCTPSGPEANPDALHKAEHDYAAGGSKVQDVLDALRRGDTDCAKSALDEAIAGLKQGRKDTADGVGGSFDLSQLPTSDPLRRVGSGRQAILSGQNELEDVRKALDGCNPDMKSIIGQVQHADTNIQGGQANIHKADNLIDNGLQDHRPKTPNPDTCPEPTPHPEPQPEPKPLPTLVDGRDHEMHTGQNHVEESYNRIKQASAHVLTGNFSDAVTDLQKALKANGSATKDLGYAFGGEVPGGDYFDKSNSQILDSITQMLHGNFNQALKEIRRAQSSEHVAREDVFDASGTRFY